MWFAILFGLSLGSRRPLLSLHHSPASLFFLAALLSFASMGAWAVCPGCTVTTVTSSANPSIIGQSVTFTATVVPQPPQTGTATGTVSFSDGVTTIGSGILNGVGVATFSTSALAAGSHTIAGHYGGDDNWLASSGSMTGNPQVVTINTTTAVTSSLNPSVLGQQVTFTATVSPVAPGTGTPTGSVDFSDGVTVIGSGILTGGVATLSTSVLAVGSHTMTTTYAGDGTFNGSPGSLTGNPQVVNKASSTTTVSTDCMTKFVELQPFTLSATVSGASPTGSVTFSDGGGVLCSNVALSAGIATCTSSVLAVGGLDTETPYSLNASYGGDGNNTASASVSPLVITVLRTADVVFRNGFEPESLSCPIE